MISKYVVVVSLLLAVAAASTIPSKEQSTDLVFNYNEVTHSKSNERYHLVFGKRLYGDVLQFEERVQGQSGLRVRFNIESNLLINAVTVVDLNQHGNGDYPILVDGGIDSNYIILQFLSAGQKDVDFFVTIYGH